MGCALFDHFPELAGALPHRPLGEFPTAIERVTGLLPRAVELWVKREDRAGALYGGNKVRKLEFLLGDPRLQGPRAHRRVITFGGYGSHHVLALALYGRPLGLQVDAVVFPQPPLSHARDTLRCSLAAGARLYASGGYLGTPRQLLRALRSGERPLLLGPGGSSPLGTLGWLSGALEIGDQVRGGAAPRFDAVYAALGSGGTAAGLWLGLGDAAGEVVAVRVVPALVGNAPLCRRLARQTAALLPPPLRRRLPPPPPLRVDGRFLGPGYGSETEATSRAIARAADAGLVLDAVYTGRVLAALLSDAESGRLDGKRVLLLNSVNSRDLSALRAAPLPALPPRLAGFGAAPHLASPE